MKGQAYDYYRNMNLSPLTAKEEKALSKRILAGDGAAVEKLVMHNAKFACMVASRYSGRGSQDDDLVSAAISGMLAAAKRYDYRKGCKFISYAVWYVRQSVQKELADNGHAVRIPRNQTRGETAVYAFYRANPGKSISDYDLEEIAAGSQQPVSNIRPALTMRQRSVSLDRGRNKESEGEGSTYKDMIVDAAPGPDDVLAAASRRALCERMIADLPPKHRAVMEMLYLSGDEVGIYDAAGARLGLCRERIRQIKVESLAKMKARFGRAARLELMD